MLAILFASGLIWFQSVEYAIQSEALGQERKYRVFNGDSQGSIIYSLDGQSLRNGLAPATLFAIGAIVQGTPPPKVIAIYSGKDRDRDFRQSKGEPTHWRPVIAGHSAKFDIFLMDELRAEVETKSAGSKPTFLMGHSLAGLYGLGLAARRPGYFSGVFVFAPTFSHDTSISLRLPEACDRGTVIYANWGLESQRDTLVFEAVIKDWLSHPRCMKHAPKISYHFSSLHQTIMLTGQMELAWRGLN
jgi:predicted alpha/beta superfamily hydrolase